MLSLKLFGRFEFFERKKVEVAFAFDRRSRALLGRNLQIAFIRDIGFISFA